MRNHTCIITTRQGSAGVSAQSRQRISASQRGARLAPFVLHHGASCLVRGVPADQVFRRLHVG